MNFFQPNGQSSEEIIPPEGNWMGHLTELWQWDHLAAEVSQESQARVVVAGLEGVGKSLLFNRLRGWELSGKSVLPAMEAGGWQTEAYGFFILVDLSPPPAEPMGLAQEMLLSLGEPALILYLLDGTTGITPADYRWLAALRATGKPILAAMNKMDAAASPGVVLADAELRLGMPIIPISAQTGSNIEARLLPAMLNAVPRLAVPLGRELLGLRRAAARRVIRQAALFAGVVGAQPVPLFDLPVQVMVQVGMVLRIAAAFGYAPTGGTTREVIGTVISSLGLRYLALYLLKFIPILGWALMGVVSAAATFTLGELAIRYYEAGATIPLSQWSRRYREQLQAKTQAHLRWWRGRWQAWRHQLPRCGRPFTIPTPDQMEEIPVEGDEA